MSEYPGNVFADIERALADGRPSIVLSASQMRQALAVAGGITEAKNGLVRENNALRSENVRLCRELDKAYLPDDALCEQRAEVAAALEADGFVDPPARHSPPGAAST